MNKLYRLLAAAAIMLPLTAFSQQNQTKQADMNGKEVCADAPWRMMKTDQFGATQGLPVTIFIDDADLFSANAELVSISIRLKNATDCQFTNTVTFDNYTDSAFLALFSDKSVTDNQLDCQAFDPSLPVKDASKTIVFTANNCGWPFTCTYVDVTRKFWYFTITIPPDKLTGYSDIIDIEVNFELRWEPDNTTRLRVFRSNEDIPHFAGWYRGDTHFHTMYTQNQIEFGLPLSASRTAAKKVGLDWITVTDHSTDYDNYGSDMQTNWAKQGFDILDQNSQDSTFVFIRGLESSQLNSAGQLIHMLNYPSESNPYMMNFVADGGGDIVATHNTVANFLNALAPTGGFAYAAHPFSEADKLSSAGNGGLWNVSDSGFLSNGSVIDGGGSVLCNDPAMASDIFDTNTANGLMRNYLAGGEIWNCAISMQTTDDYSDPWNVTCDNGTTPFAALSDLNADNYMYRLKCGLSVADFANRRGLAIKNQNSATDNFKFFITAGSDAHGSFNYSNTSFLMGITGTIDDNAIGKLSTLTYCPGGMGHYGNNILHALKKGYTILSDGPLVRTSLRFSYQDTDRLFPGRDTCLSENAFHNACLHIEALSNAEFGVTDTLTLTLCTAASHHTLKVPLSGNYTENLNFNVDSLFAVMTNGDSLYPGEYFFVRAELLTLKDYAAEAGLYRRSYKYFHSITNPIWIGKEQLITGIAYRPNLKVNVYPNPANDLINLDCSSFSDGHLSIAVFDMNSRQVFERSAVHYLNSPIKLDIAALHPGMYMIIIQSEHGKATARFIKN